MIDKPIRMDHAEADRKRILFVDWLLGNKCNFKCSYCPDILHNGSRTWPASDNIIVFARRLLELSAARGQTVHIQFTGGEVTINPELPLILSSLKQLGCRLALISNGARTASFWSRIAEF